MFFDDFQKMIESEIENLSDKDKQKQLNTLQRALKSFEVSQSYIFAKDENETLNFKELVKNPLDKGGDKKTVSISVIDLSKLPQEKDAPILKNYVSEVCTQIITLAQKMKVDKQVKLLLIFDESQNYLPRPGDTFNSIRRILTGGASYGIKAWVIAQSPQLIDQEATKQLTTLICANVDQSEIRNYISMHVSDSSWIDKLNKTRLGKALMFNKDTQPSGKLCLTFTTPQTVDILGSTEIVEMASKKDK